MRSSKPKHKNKFLFDFIFFGQNLPTIGYIDTTNQVYSQFFSTNGTNKVDVMDLKFRDNPLSYLISLQAFATLLEHYLDCAQEKSAREANGELTQPTSKFSEKLDFESPVIRYLIDMQFEKGREFIKAAFEENRFNLDLEKRLQLGTMFVEALSDCIVDKLDKLRVHLNLKNCEIFNSVVFNAFDLLLKCHKKLDIENIAQTKLSFLVKEFNKEFIDNVNAVAQLTFRSKVDLKTIHVFQTLELLEANDRSASIEHLLACFHICHHAISNGNLEKAERYANKAKNIYSQMPREEVSDLKEAISARFTDNLWVKLSSEFFRIHKYNKVAYWLKHSMNLYTDPKMLRLIASDIENSKNKYLSQIKTMIDELDINNRIIHPSFRGEKLIIAIDCDTMTFDQYINVEELKVALQKRLEITKPSQSSEVVNKKKSQDKSIKSIKPISNSEAHINQGDWEHGAVLVPKKNKIKQSKEEMEETDEKQQQLEDKDKIKEANASKLANASMVENINPYDLAPSLRAFQLYEIKTEHNGLRIFGYVDRVTCLKRMPEEFVDANEACLKKETKLGNDVIWAGTDPQKGDRLKIAPRGKKSKSRIWGEEALPAICTENNTTVRFFRFDDVKTTHAEQKKAYRNLN